MKILTNGCSFTAHSPYLTWPYLLGTDAVKNIAQHSAGNQWICNSTIAELSENSYDLVLVMWSGLERLDYTVEEAVYLKSTGFKSVNNFGIHYLHNEQDAYKNLSVDTGQRERVFNSLMQIISLQSYLQAHNINFKFMSYMNFWEDVYRLGFEYLDRQIDFSHWIFTDNDRNGLFELSQDSKLYIADGYHPNQQAHEQWAELVRKNINA
jgi:hypothetical protein